MEPEYYWLCFSGVNLAGQDAESNFPVVFFGTETQAGEEAYMEAYQMAESEVDEEDGGIFDDPAETMADYFCRKLNQKDLDNCGDSLKYEVIREINRIGQHTIKEVEEKYGVSLETD